MKKILFSSALLLSAAMSHAQLVDHITIAFGAGVMRIQDNYKERIEVIDTASHTITLLGYKDVNQKVNVLQGDLKIGMQYGSWFAEADINTTVNLTWKVLGATGWQFGNPDPVDGNGFSFSPVIGTNLRELYLGARIQSGVWTLQAGQLGKTPMVTVLLRGLLTAR